ncbi:MAG: helix-turn-helix transcriptional regulator [Acidimicrobiales bacterium]
MTTDEVASYLGIPVSTLYQWRYRGTAPRAIRVGRHTRYRARDIDAWVESHAVGGEAK